MPDRHDWRDAPITIADIGTGSGILIITLLCELPRARGIATDVSTAALDVARRNARLMGIADDRLTFVEGRGLGGQSGGRGGGEKVDLIVSNPPYIPTAEIQTLETGVKLFDPLVALDGGVDGLEIYREIASEISALYGSVRVAVEVGAAQADDVAAIFEKAGGRNWVRRQDLGSHFRVVAFEIQR